MPVQTEDHAGATSRVVLPKRIRSWQGGKRSVGGGSGIAGRHAPSRIKVELDPLDSTKVLSFALGSSRAEGQIASSCGRGNTAGLCGPGKTAAPDTKITKVTKGVGQRLPPSAAK